MPAKAPQLAPSATHRLVQLGEQLRLARKRQQVTAAAAAEAAGMSRVTLHRIERGEPSVTVGAWLAAAAALGLELSLADPSAAASPSLPEKVRLADYPQLRQLAWHLAGVEELTPQEALSLYESNWRHVDGRSLSMKEIALINSLAVTIGGGRPLV